MQREFKFGTLINIHVPHKVGIDKDLPRTHANLYHAIDTSTGFDACVLTSQTYQNGQVAMIDIDEVLSGKPVYSTVRYYADCTGQQRSVSAGITHRSPATPWAGDVKILVDRVDPDPAAPGWRTVSGTIDHINSTAETYLQSQSPSLRATFRPAARIELRTMQKDIYPHSLQTFNRLAALSASSGILYATDATPERDIPGTPAYREKMKIRF